MTEEAAAYRAPAVRTEVLPAAETEVAPNQTSDVLDMIVRAATNPAIDVEKMERLMAMHERIVNQKAEADFNQAMAKAQAKMHPVVADAENPQTKSRYASYAALDRALRPIYTEHGFALSFDTGSDAPEGYIRVLCYASHGAGFMRTYKADMPADGKGAKGGDVMTKTHAAGSAFTYGQRYLLRMVFNIAVGPDDDGQGAGMVYITAEQKEELIALLRETGFDTTKFLKWLKVDNLDVLQARFFDRAKDALEQKRGAA